METENQNIVKNSAIQRIRKTARFHQLDDFAIIGTPPAIGSEGPLFSNTIGNRSIERGESTYDRINRELSLGEKPLVVNNTIKDNFSDSVSASLSVGLSGICVKPIKAPIVLPEQNFLIASDDIGLPHKLSITNPSHPRARKISNFDSKLVDQNALLEVFNELKALKQENASAITAPALLPAVEQLPATAALSRQRKSSAPPSLGPGYLMDSNKTTMANFFFNGGLTSFRNKMTGNANHSEVAEVGVVPALNDQKIALTDSVVKTDANIDPAFNTSPAVSPSIVNQKVVKRRLKKTALREMNLYAPQSM